MPVGSVPDETAYKGASSVSGAFCHGGLTRALHLVRMNQKIAESYGRSRKMVSTNGDWQAQASWGGQVGDFRDQRQVVAAETIGPLPLLALFAKPAHGYVEPTAISRRHGRLRVEDVEPRSGGVNPPAR
jgi:hypothetical protein